MSGCHHNQSTYGRRRGSTRYCAACEDPRTYPTCTQTNPPCGKPARFYPRGWCCDEHQPANLPKEPK